VAAFPSLFTSVDPGTCRIKDSLEPAGPGHPFGFDRQGCDVYARVIFGARASVSVGVLTTLGVTLIGGMMGAVAGYVGRWVDALLSRIGDIFFAVPLVLAAVVFMTAFPERRSVLTVSLVLMLFFWPQIARITRGAVVSVKDSEFVTAARALGASDGSILGHHVIPNALAPVIVTATVALGTFIVVEATLSFLGVGLPPGVVSWGADISAARATMRTNPLVLLYPAAALALTVLSFIMMGDVVRDALDPKARTR
jgi:oligopeptide transport system permease protein